MATLQAQLDEARAAYHNLMTGQSVVELHDQNGEVIKYSAASAPRLAAYIAGLERRLSGGGLGPMRVFF